MQNAIVVGAGIAGMSGAACLARDGFDVTVLEKNGSSGGRARKFQAAGFTFDMGPSWYWMPDVYERFFNEFGRKVSDYYTLTKLDPSYRIYYDKGDFEDVPAGIEALCSFFEKHETGSSRNFLRFLEEGSYKYQLGMQRLVYKPGLTWRELIDAKVMKGIFSLHVFRSFATHVRKFFKHPRLIELLEFPVLFLGAAPAETPALYSLMNFADMVLGTWYPMGGMNRIARGIERLCAQLGVKFMYNEPAKRIEVQGNTATGVWTAERFYPADRVIAGADYQHVEKDLLEARARQYTPEYWNTRIMAPSCLIFYVGVNKRVANLLHHTLFFDEDMRRHISEIYHAPRWPTAPQFYVCCPSKTDPTVAPPDCENLFILIPVATRLEDKPEIREKYFAMVMGRIEKLTGECIQPSIVFRKSYAHNDFIMDYNAFRGNAYGLANTLMQTANLKPRIASNRVRNLYFTGQLTVPGPGVPPALISGLITASAVSKGLLHQS